MADTDTTDEKTDFARSQHRFVAADVAGEVSAILLRPEAAKWCFVFAHGAALNIVHPSMIANAQALAAAGIASFRFNFPYAEARRQGPGQPQVMMETIRRGIEAAKEAAPDMRYLAGGRSMGGMLTAQLQANAALPDVEGLVLLAYPFHNVDQEEVAGTEHLAGIEVPMLFVSGTADPLAKIDLVEAEVGKLGDKATLKTIESGDHGFNVSEDASISQEEAWSEVGNAVADWARSLD